MPFWKKDDALDIAKEIKAKRAAAKAEREAAQRKAQHMSYYAAEKLDKAIAFSEYLAEQVEKTINQNKRNDGTDNE